MKTKKQRQSKKNEIKNFVSLSVNDIQNTFFEHNLIIRNLVSRTDVTKEDIDHDKEEQRIKESLAVFNPQDAQQLMLIAQITSIHELQQHMTACARVTSKYHGIASGYISAVTKLSNAFTQQLMLLHKLQGKNQQQVTIEQVNVQAGGQAIVGTIENYEGSSKNEKEKS